MKYKIEIQADFLTHNEIINKVMKQPEIIHKNFKPIRQELPIAKGRIDIIGKLNDQYCLVEVKTDYSRNGLVSSARRQLIRYAKTLNTYQHIHKQPIIDYCFVIIRKTRIKMEIFIYNNLTDIRKRTNTKGASYEKYYHSGL